MLVTNTHNYCLKDQHNTTQHLQMLIQANILCIPFWETFYTIEFHMLIKKMNYNNFWSSPNKYYLFGNGTSIRLS